MKQRLLQKKSNLGLHYLFVNFCATSKNFYDGFYFSINQSGHKAYSKITTIKDNVSFHIFILTVEFIFLVQMQEASDS